VDFPVAIPPLKDNEKKEQEPKAPNTPDDDIEARVEEAVQKKLESMEARLLEQLQANQPPR
jgi:hypothetical protein